MKKTIIALALLLAFGSFAFAQHQANPQQILKKISKQVHGEKWLSIYVPQFVVVENGEVSATRYAYTYDEDYLLSTLEEQSMEGGAWTTHTVSVYDYDWNGNVLEIISKDAITEEEISMETFTYDADGNPSEDVYLEWDGTQWVNVSKLVYNFSDEMISIILWEWNGNTWAASYLYTYTVIGDTEELLIQYMEGGAWQNEQKVTTSFIGDKKIGEALMENWENNAWANSLKMNYYYTNDLCDRITHSSWNNGTWDLIWKSEYVYDSYGNAISGESFCDWGSGWQNCSGTLEMRYGDDYDLIEYEGIRFDAEYFDVTSVEEGLSWDGFTFYPNPVNDVLVVRSDDFQKAEVYNMTGSKLLESTSNKVNVSGLQSGMYLLKVQGGNTGCQARVFVVK